MVSFDKSLNKTHLRERALRRNVLQDWCLMTNSRLWARAYHKNVPQDWHLATNFDRIFNRTCWRARNVHQNVLQDQRLMKNFGNSFNRIRSKERQRERERAFHKNVLQDWRHAMSFWESFNRTRLRAKALIRDLTKLAGEQELFAKTPCKILWGRVFLSVLSEVSSEQKISTETFWKID